MKSPLPRRAVFVVAASCSRTTERDLARGESHLIHLRCGDPGDAETLLRPVVASGDPEVRWRLAEVMASLERFEEAEAELAAARSEFEMLLGRHPLAFADHAAEFYAGSGKDLPRALGLARANVANRPTLRAYEQAHRIAIDVGASKAAADLIAEATRRWGTTAAFRRSSLVARPEDSMASGARP